MKWNWEHKSWPEFTYRFEVIEPYESRFLHKAGLVHGSLKHISQEDQNSLTIELISDEALKTSEIEGEFLNLDSLRSSVKRSFGLHTDHRKVSPAERGVSEMMVDLYKTYQDPLDHNKLFSWHETLMQGRRDLIAIGAYRMHEDPMQIVSSTIVNPKVYFEAPPSNRVHEEMDRFITWFNKAGSEGGTGFKTLTRAAITHLYFESIHPFEDGNGRIGRALSEKAFSQELRQPTLIALATTIEANKKVYYEALHRNSRDMEITDWLMYFCELVLSAQDNTQARIDFLIDKGKFYSRYRDQLNARQDKVIARMFKEGISGFKGGLSADNYITIARTSRATATRDLQDLVMKGALLRTGERRYTRYYLNISLNASIR